MGYLYLFYLSWWRFVHCVYLKNDDDDEIEVMEFGPYRAYMRRTSPLS